MADTPETILSRLAQLIREVIGEDWAQDVPIHAATSFNRDLEIESIEFVALAERIQTEWGARVDFPSWLGEMELEQIIALTVGDVASFIERCLSST